MRTPIDSAQIVVYKEFEVHIHFAVVTAAHFAINWVCIAYMHYVTEWHHLTLWVRTPIDSAQTVDYTYFANVCFWTCDLSPIKKNTKNTRP